MRLPHLLIAVALMLPLASSSTLPQGAPAPMRLPKGSTGPADGLTVGGTPIPAILGSKAPLASPTFTGEVASGSTRLTEIGTNGAFLEMRQNGLDTGGGTNQWRWLWGKGRALNLAAYDSAGSYIGFPFYVTQSGKDQFNGDTGLSWPKMGTDYPFRAYNVVNPTNRLLGEGINDFTTVNNSKFATAGHFFKYLSKASDGGYFDTGFSLIADFAPAAKTADSRPPTFYLMSSITRCPRRSQVDALSIVYSCAQAEHNVVNLDRDYGFIASLDVATPITGMMVLVPESFDGPTQHVGYDTSYGIAFARSGDTGANGTYVRTHTALLGSPNAISPGDGRFIHATGAKAEYLVGTPTAGTSPYAFAQVAGAWQHGIDMTEATLFGGDALSMADGQAVTWSGGAKLSGAAGAVTVGGLLALKPYTVSGLPTCNTAVRDGMAVVTDAASPAYRGALTGGGTVRTPVYCDGSAWTAH